MNSTASSPRFAPRLSQRLAQAVGKQRAIGQVGEYVVVCQMLDERFGRLALGNVARTADGTEDLAVGIDQARLMDFKEDELAENLTRFLKDGRSSRPRVWRSMSCANCP